MLYRLLPLFLLAACRSVASEGTTTQVHPLHYAVAGELAAELRQVFLGHASLQIVADQRTNSLVLSGPSADVTHAAYVVESLDKPADASTSRAGGDPRAAE